MSSDGGGASASAEEQLSAAVVQLLQSDLKIVAEDYQLLKRLNDAASQKYGNMSTVTRSLGLYVDDVAGKYKSFEPYLAKVDQICDEVAQIEQTVLLLDDYTMRLEAKFVSASPTSSTAASPAKK